MRRRYATDTTPREIVCRYPAACAETGKPIVAGAAALYYPSTRKLFALDSATAADWRAAEFDRRCLGANY